ncbi:unnamed protein product [Rotaria socialis]
MSEDDDDDVEIETTSPTPISSTSLPLTKRKKGVFRRDWLSIDRYSSWLQEVNHDLTKARCKTCLKTFSVHCDGKSAVEKHVTSYLHKKSMKAFENNCSLAQFVIPERELDKITAAECVFVFHGVKHGHSYRSQECTINLIRNAFESSSLAKSISCGRTKSRAIACNVLGPYFTNKVIDDLLKAQYYSLSVDASNKGNCKIFPFAVQYFSPTGVRRGLIEFISDPHEAAVDIFNNICKIIDDNKLLIENLTSYGADNANVNYGEHHLVFQFLKSKVPHLLKGNCFCHVLHNAVHAAHDELPIDIEAILCKLYSYFSRSAKRIESLKEYFEFVQTEFSVLLQHIRTRWLSLLRSIERLLENFEPLKLFFLNQQTSTDAQRLLQSFFNDIQNLCILYFLQNILFEIQKAELQLQRSYTTAVDLHFIITNLLNKLQQKLFDKYYGNNTRLILNKLKEIDEKKCDILIKTFDSFINQVIEYVKSYYDDNSEFYEKLSYFSVQSFKFLTWKNVVDVLDMIHIRDLDEDKLYSEFYDAKSLYDNLKTKSIKLHDQVKSYISSKTNEFSISNVTNQNFVHGNSDSEDEETVASSSSSSNDTNEDFIRSDELWAYSLNTSPNETANFKKIICYIFSIPCSNSFVESIFSNMKHCWNDYRNRMNTELISSELKIRINSNYSCNQFYRRVLSEPQLLKQSRQNAKY